MTTISMPSSRQSDQGSSVLARVIIGAFSPIISGAVAGALYAYFGLLAAVFGAIVAGLMILSWLMGSTHWLMHSGR